MLPNATGEATGTMANDYLLDWLWAFNRKERYYLLSQALGGFSLTPQFAAELSEVAGVAIPPNALAYMDYHLDWVYAALKVWDQPTSITHTEYQVSPDFAQPGKDKGPIFVNHDMEDIDLLVAFQQEGINHLIFVEAKGETPWSNSQMESKVYRLNRIFEDAPQNVRPLLVLVSPGEPKLLRVPDFAAEWAYLSPTKWKHLKLTVPSGRRKLERPSKGSDQWRVAPSAPTEIEPNEDEREP